MGDLLIIDSYLYAATYSLILTRRNLTSRDTTTRAHYVYVMSYNVPLFSFSRRITKGDKIPSKLHILLFEVAVYTIRFISCVHKLKRNQFNHAYKTISSLYS